MSVLERIPIVDDEQQIRELVRRLLERGGYDCTTAKSAAGATQLLGA